MAYSFTLRSGLADPLVDARIAYAGGYYDIDGALTSGGGTITTSDDALAASLRQVCRADGLTLLVEGLVSPGSVSDRSSPIQAYVQRDEPSSGAYVWVQIERDGNGNPVVDTDGTVSIADIKVKLG